MNEPGHARTEGERVAPASGWRRKRLLGRAPIVLAWLLFIAGCTRPGPLFTPPLFAPLFAPPAPPPIDLPPGAEILTTESNPVFIELGHKQYGYVFEACLKTLLDYEFEIVESNRYDGRVETAPRVAPGVLRFFQPGSPDLYQRILATTQTYRHRVSLNIQPADNSGYFIEVVARKELEDLPKPIRGTVGGAVFRSENTVERQFEVIDPVFFEPMWIFQGRDAALEDEIIRRLVRCLSAAPG